MPARSIFPPCSPINNSDLTSASAHPALAQRRIEVSFGDLREFETVQDQYSSSGIQFNSAIAVQPTNASFLTEQMGVMPMGEQMKLTIAFEMPPHRIQLRITGASVIHAMLFDPALRPLTRPFSKRLPLLPQSVPRQSETAACSAPISPAFPQYELDLTAIEFWDKTAASSQGYPPQIYQVELQSASPFVIQWLAIDVEAEQIQAGAE